MAFIALGMLVDGIVGDGITGAILITDIVLSVMAMVTDMGIMVTPMDMGITTLGILLIMDMAVVIMATDITETGIMAIVIEAMPTIEAEEVITRATTLPVTVSLGL
jgi:hypothetical protein